MNRCRRSSSRSTVEDPRLCVQTGGGGVVRDLDLGAESAQRLERPQLGAVRVGGRDETERLAVLAVAAQRIEQRLDPAPPHERHDDVDRVGGVNLGAQFVADGGLSG